MIMAMWLPCPPAHLRGQGPWSNTCLRCGAALAVPCAPEPARDTREVKIELRAWQIARGEGKPMTANEKIGWKEATLHGHNAAPVPIDLKGRLLTNRWTDERWAGYLAFELTGVPELTA